MNAVLPPVDRINGEETLAHPVFALGQRKQLVHPADVVGIWLSLGLRTVCR